MAKYAYDPFGQVLSVTNASGTAISPTAANVANYNPFRYRGYYYDTESGFYYLQSRYYDPKICRFINADSCITTGQGFLGFNMFAYCLNNPIKYTDNGGEFGLLAVAFTLFAIAIVALAAPIIVECVSNIVHALGEVINDCITVARPVYIDSAIDNPNKSNLPDHGPTSEIPDAPAVDAWEQGKHVPGHPNSREGKTQWGEGETGVQQTQEAWKNGQVVRDPSKGEIRVGESSDGRTVRVHKGRHGWIHGYPLEVVPELF